MSDCPPPRSHRDSESVTMGSGKLADGEAVLLGELELDAGDPVPSRDRVEPSLAALLQVEHLNLLVGSGLTTALVTLVDSKTVVDMGAKLPLKDNQLARSIESAAKAAAGRAGRGEPNIEDRLKIAIAAVDGLRTVGDDRADDIECAIDCALNTLRNAISIAEVVLRYGANGSSKDTTTVKRLLHSFLGSFTSRPANHDRLHLFTTNYDRVIEWGAEFAGLRIVDRFVGSLEPIFRSSRLEVDYHYSPPGSVHDPRYLDGVFRLTKLHGSLDWRSDKAARRVVRVALPFGGTPDLRADELLIYPQASKDVETIYYPYGELFRDFSGALCRPHSALVIYGYGFGDDHINRIISDMLAIPSTHLLIISYDDKYDRIKTFVSDHGRVGQVSYLIGSSVADLQRLVAGSLPRPASEPLRLREAEIQRGRSRVANNADTATEVAELRE